MRPGNISSEEFPTDRCFPAHASDLSDHLDPPPTNKNRTTSHRPNRLIDHMMLIICNALRRIVRVH